MIFLGIEDCLKMRSNLTEGLNTIFFVIFDNGLDVYG